MITTDVVIHEAELVLNLFRQLPVEELPQLAQLEKDFTAALADWNSLLLTRPDRAYIYNASMFEICSHYRAEQLRCVNHASPVSLSEQLKQLQLNIKTTNI